VRVLARLRPGVSLAQAEQDVDRVAREFQQERSDIYTGNLYLEVYLDPLGAGNVARVRPVLLTLSGAVLFVLLIACANVANLLLARAAVRQREMAVRHALGASTLRLVAQSITEGLLLTMFGAALGCVLARAIVALMASLSPSFVAGLAHVSVDMRILAFTLAISVITALLCGLAPALGWTRLEVTAILKQSGRQGASQERHRLRARSLGRSERPSGLSIATFPFSTYAR
jgi:putative ABC transport system permease protein